MPTWPETGCVVISLENNERDCRSQKRSHSLLRNKKSANVDDNPPASSNSQDPFQAHNCKENFHLRLWGMNMWQQEVTGVLPARDLMAKALFFVAIQIHIKRTAPEVDTASSHQNTVRYINMKSSLRFLSKNNYFKSHQSIFRLNTKISHAHTQNTSLLVYTFRKINP